MQYPLFDTIVGQGMFFVLALQKEMQLQDQREIN